MEDELKEYINLVVLIKLFCYKEEIKQKINYQKKDAKLYKKIYTNVAFIKKNVINKYKEIFQYKILCNALRKNNTKILDNIKDYNKIINYENLNDYTLKQIINQLDKNLINKIKNINEPVFLDSINKEFNIKWNFHSISFDNKENKITLKYLDDFEIINFDIYHLLLEQKIDLYRIPFGAYILGYKKLFISFKDSSEIIFQICYIDKKGNYKAEYLFDRYNFVDSNSLLNNINLIGINKLIEQFKRDQVINFISFDNNNFPCYKIINENGKVGQKNNIVSQFSKVKSSVEIDDKNLTQNNFFIQIS